MRPARTAWSTAARRLSISARQRRNDSDSSADRIDSSIQRVSPTAHARCASRATTSRSFACNRSSANWRNVSNWR